MKKVLITGGAGFIAHHIIAHIIKNTDWEIVTIDRLDISGNLNRLNEILNQFSDKDKKRLKIVFHDLKSEINPWIKKELGEVNIILHLAAGSHVDRSIDYPMEFVLDNVVGTANILDYGRFINDNNGLERFIYFSTDEVFGPAPPGIYYKENDRYYPGYTSNEDGISTIITKGLGKTFWSAYCGAMQEAARGFLISINSERSFEKNELTPLRRISPNLDVSWQHTVMEKASGSSGSSQKKNRSIDRQIEISLFDSKIRCSFKDGIYIEYSDLENSADLIREMKKEGHGILKTFKGFDGMGTPVAFGITIWIRFKQ
mgnify:CR=1 FL=1